MGTGRITDHLQEEEGGGKKRRNGTARIERKGRF
jgi:hypothetical protein